MRHTMGSPHNSNQSEPVHQACRCCCVAAACSHSAEGGTGPALTDQGASSAHPACVHAALNICGVAAACNETAAPSATAA